jgi:NADH-quinone oxidoreductase subunit K
MTPELLLLVVFTLFAIGLYCITLKNMIRILFGVEIILNAGNLAFIHFASHGIPTGLVDPLGQSIVFISIVTGGCILAVGLALIVNAYKHYKTINIEELRRLRW